MQKKDESQFELVGELVSIFLRASKWYVNYQFDGRQHRKSLKTTSKKEARLRALAIERDLLSGEHRTATKPPTIAAAVKLYTDHLRAEGRAKKTLQKYEKLFECVIVLSVQLKRTSVLGIDQSFVDAFRKSRTEAGCAARTVYNESMIIRQLINFSRTRKLIRTDPLSGLQLKKPTSTPQPCWTPEEVEQILASSRAAVWGVHHAVRHRHACWRVVLAHLGRRGFEFERDSCPS